MPTNGMRERLAGRKQVPVAVFLAVLSCVLASERGVAQDLEPRAYSLSPVGANFLVFAYASQSGDVLFDPSLPFSDVTANINSVAPGYGRAFSAFGRTASVLFALPYAWGNMQGNVGEEYTRITRSGLADARARLAVNLIGGPAMTPREFAQRKTGTTLGASLLISAPTGQYSPEKLINVGTNRWAFKPELGFAHPIGPWSLEAYAGVWLFTRNTKFYGSKVRSQDPLWTFQAHVTYNFKPRLWLALDATFYTGGITYSDGGSPSSRQENSRGGATLAIPLWKQHSLKFAYARGVASRVGSKFETIAVAYQYFWLDK